jgi:ligand-binding sensor domain-containing protein
MMYFWVWKTTVLCIPFFIMINTVHAREMGQTSRATGAVAVSGEYLWLGTEKGALRMDMEKGVFRRFGVEDGLAGVRVNSIAADSAVVLWFGTDGGLTRFDGNSWVSYTPSNSKIPGGVGSLALDRDGSVWFTNGNVVTRFDGSAWTAYMPDDSLNIGGFGDIAISPNGAKWFHTWNTVVRFDGKGWKTFILWYPFPGDEKPTIKTLRCDSKGTVWLGSAGILGGEVMSYDGKTWTPHHFQDSNVTAMCIDLNNVKWFASYHKLVRYDGDTWSYYAPENFFYEHYRGAVADRLGRIWLVHDYHVVRFDNGNWKEFPLDTVTGVSGERAAVSPQSLRLTNSPNPFNPSTTISYTISAPSQVNLSVYSITGQKVRELFSRSMSAGTHSALWDGNDDSGHPGSSGVYISRLESGGMITASRMLLLR